MRRRIILTLLLVVALSTNTVFAESLDSTNYKLLDPQIGAVSGTSASDNYAILVQGGSGIGLGEISSSLYKLGSGQGFTFMANVPKVSCFETVTTSMTTDCVSLPANNGMVGECGEGGCYDRAMLQIDTQANPTDTLYSIQLSSDNWATTYILDGTTRTLKAASSKSIADYKTKAQWEGSPWNRYNILGLQPDTEYKVRLTALHGDFTESSPGPEAIATTGVPTTVFDLDITPDISGTSTAPYSVNLGGVSPESYTFQTNERIKLSVSTNLQVGVSVFLQDEYSGLRSQSTSFTLESDDEDLANPASGDGFGLQFTESDEAAASEGYIVPSAVYAVSGTNVGAISSIAATRVLCTLTSPSGTCGVDSQTWVTDGRALFTLGLRASILAPAVADYEDTLTFTIMGGW